jgi:hypothetical protein
MEASILGLTLEKFQDMNNNNLDLQKDKSSRSKETAQQHTQTHIIISKCLSQPCPIFYEDIFKSILIECKNPVHDNAGAADA